MRHSLFTILLLSYCGFVIAQKTTKTTTGYKPVRTEMYKKGWIDFNKNGIKDVYEDPLDPIDARIENLISEMTLEKRLARDCLHLIMNTYGLPPNMPGHSMKCNVSSFWNCWMPICTG